MRNFLIALAMIPIIASAYTYQALDIVIPAVTTNKTETTVQTKTGIKGRVVSLSLISDTNIDFSVKTTSGRGASLSGQKTIFARTNAMAGVVTNFAASTYLFDDDLIISADHSLVGTNGELNSARGMIILEQ